MARPRLPDAVATATGADKKNPGRFKGRATLKHLPLGAPPRDFGSGEKRAWIAFADEMPWLSRSDRTVVEVASRLRSRMESDPEFPMAGFAQLRMCLSAMGGTPTDRTKLLVGDDGDEADPLDRFIN